MKRFLKTIVVLLGILLVLNVVLDFAFSRFLGRSQNLIYKSWHVIIHDTIDADLLVMGSSRAWVQYDPHVMDSMLSVNSYNLGLIGSHVKRQIVKYEVYRHYQRKRPSCLIINFDYFGNWNQNVNEGFQREQYFPHLTNIYIRRLLRLKRQESFSIGELYVPMYRYYSHGALSLMELPFGNYEKRYNEECWYKGYYWGMPQEWDGTKFAKIDKVEFSPNQDEVDEFDTFLSEVQKDSIQVIFVCSPIYAGVTKKSINLSEYYVFRSHFSEKYNIPVLDYTDDTICYDTTYFYNATHLNKTGAELFTTKLCHDLDSMRIAYKKNK